MGQTPHFYWPDTSYLLARPLTSIGQPSFLWVKPSLLYSGQTLHFCWPDTSVLFARCLTSIGQTPQFYWPNPSYSLANPSFLLARPITSIGQTPHFYWPDPSLLFHSPESPSLLLARPLNSIGQPFISLSVGVDVAVCICSWRRSDPRVKYVVKAAHVQEGYDGARIQTIAMRYHKNGKPTDAQILQISPQQLSAKKIDQSTEDTAKEILKQISAMEALKDPGEITDDVLKEVRRTAQSVREATFLSILSPSKQTKK